MKKLSTDSEGDFLNAVERMREGYPEPQVLRSIVDALMEEEEYGPANPPIHDESKGPAFFYLKTRCVHQQHRAMTLSFLRPSHKMGLSKM